MPDYDIGQTYRASIDVTDLATGAPATPSAATLTVSWRNGDGPQTTVAALAPGPGQQQLPAPNPAGHLFYDWTFTEAGLYGFSWVTVGPGGGATDYINCRAYIAAISLADALEWLGVADESRIPVVRGLVALSTKLAEDVVGPTVCRRYVRDWIPGTSRRVLRVPHPPLPDENAVESVSSVYPGGPVWLGGDLGDDLIVNPDAGTIRLRSMLDFWYGPWVATYTGGRQQVSTGIVGGIKEILWDLWATQRWLTGDTELPELADVAAFEAQLPPGYTPPKRAMELLGAEQVPGFA